MWGARVVPPEGGVHQFPPQHFISCPAPRQTCAYPGVRLSHVEHHGEYHSLGPSEEPDTWSKDPAMSEFSECLDLSLCRV